MKGEPSAEPTPLERLLADQTPFSLVSDAFCITSSKGKFRQCRVYARGNFLYAGVGSSFIRLYATGATSDPSTRLESLSVPNLVLDTTKLGVLKVIGVIALPPTIVQAAITDDRSNSSDADTRPRGSLGAILDPLAQL